MTTTPDLQRTGGTAVEAGEHTVLPMLAGDRPLGVYVLTGEGVHWYPVTARSRSVLVPLVSAAVGAGVGAAVAIRAHALRARRPAS